jgi:sugar phosphate isomerase/epimerase
MSFKHSSASFSRRSVLTAGVALAGGPFAKSQPAANDPRPAKLKVAIFSKHLQFLQGPQLAEAAANMGFDGIDITVRKGGHVEPARVRRDLPPLVKLIRRHGLEVPMITTDIVDAETPYATDVMATMSELSIRHYRWGGLRYTGNRPILAQLDDLRPRIVKLAKLNSQYRVGAMYHTHSGIDLVGASIWDLHQLLDGLDPNSVGINYDVGHATIEGGLGGWINTFRISGAHLQGIAVKDFFWKKNSSGEWHPQWTPLSEGMVHLSKFFDMVAAARFHGPLQLHFEYPLGGAESGRRDIAIARHEVFHAMERDLKRLRGYLQASRLS